MCGIFGTTKVYSDSVVYQKLNLMKFRGPDHQEYKKIAKLNGEIITLGHVRLAIMDLDNRSNQPFVYNDDISIVFNGEIYNYEQLKRQYLRDYSFRTSCDTEVICAMYQRFGKECVNYFNGMFAYVIFDKKKNILFGARDRLGKKPFYYHLTRSSFEFASQISVIKYENEFEIEALSRSFYILNGYVPDPLCIYKDIKKLRAGELFILNLATYKMEIEQYWDIFSNSCSFTTPKSYDEAKFVLKELIVDSVKSRLNADVPLGMFLSGGVDSSLTAAIIASLNRNICAYTIGFNDRKYNESDYACETAQYLGIPIKVNKCEGKEMLDMFSDFSYYFDEPFADHSLIPTSLLAKKTKQDVTVAIGGDGGDEHFFGYPRYFSLEKKEIMYRLPFHLRRFLYACSGKYNSNHNVDLLKYRDLDESYISRGDYGFLYNTQKFDPIQLASLLPDLDYLNKERGFLRFSDYDIKHYLNSCINTKVDRASMRFSLELRSPLMDYRISEYSRLLPYDFLYSKETGGKRILKDLLYEMIPKEMLDRPKTGFCAPVGSWFKNEMKEQFLDVISYDNLVNYLPELKPEVTIKLRDQFLDGRDINETTFFKYYSYIIWAKTNINK